MTTGIFEFFKPAITCTIIIIVEHHILHNNAGNKGSI